MTTNNSRPSKSLLECRYAMPRPTLSDSDYSRAYHDDLPGVENWALDAEFQAVLSRLYIEPDVRRRSWLVERRARILAEQNRRQTSQRPDSGRQKVARLD